MKTAVVILNWNGEKYLKQFLAPLLRSLKGYDAQVTVADNNSLDASVAYMESTFGDKVRVLCLDRNYGFAEGYNRALAQISATYYLLLNSDVLVEADWLYALEEWMDLHPDCAACGPKILSYAERDRFEYAGAAGGLMDRYGYSFCRGRVLGRTEKDEGQYDTPEDVFWCSGACMMVRAEAWKQLGGFDREYFAHFEEIDFCWRARLEGWRISYVPRSRVWHVGGGTLPQDSPWKLKLNFRNNLLTLRKNYARTAALDLFFEMAATVATIDNGGGDAWNCCYDSLREMPEELLGELIDTASRDGVKSGKRAVLRRMLLDGCSAVVYLLQGRKNAFKAVVEAHREYRKLEKAPDVGEEESCRNCIRGFLQRGDAGKMLSLNLEAGLGQKVKVKAMLDGWMVYRALHWKDQVHDRLNEEIPL